MIGIGVIGYGYWGPNLVRNFAEAKDARVVAVCDRRPQRLALAQSRYPAIRTYTDEKELLAAPDIDAVAIATPVHTHFDVAMAALQAGKHVLVEKPMAVSAEQAQRMIDEAEKRKLQLMVDHTFIYTPAVRKIKQIITDGELGDIYYYDSTRVNLGLFQHDVNVVWDLAVHDLSILDFLLADKPVAVSATGMSHVPGEPENVAYITLFFATNVVAHINVNWLSPVKVRQTMIGGSWRMLVYDDIEPSEKVRIYDRGINLKPSQEDVYRLLVSYRSGDMRAPHLETTEALRMEADEFVRCVRDNHKPFNDGHAGLRVVRILEAAAESMKLRGAAVQIAGV